MSLDLKTERDGRGVAMEMTKKLELLTLELDMCLPQCTIVEALLDDFLI